MLLFCVCWVDFIRYAVGSVGCLWHSMGPHILRGHSAQGSSKFTSHPHPEQESCLDLATHFGNGVFIKNQRLGYPSFLLPSVVAHSYVLTSGGSGW